jgi:hypothetical protein
VHRVADCIIRRVIPQPTEWQDIKNEINAAFILARADFVSVYVNQGATYSFTISQMWQLLLTLLL